MAPRRLYKSTEPELTAGTGDAPLKGLQQGSWAMAGLRGKQQSAEQQHRGCPR